MGASTIRNAVIRRKAFEPSAEGEAKARVFTFVASDGDFDRYQDRLSVKGWKLDAFNDNPVIFYNHDAGQGGFFTAPSKALPIGKGKARVDGEQLLIDIEFDQKDAFAVEVARKLDEGFLSAGSVRYLMNKYHENERGGFDVDEQELLEFSIVTIPGNARAVLQKDAGEADAAIDAIADRVVERIAKRAVPAANSPKSNDVSTLAKALADAIAELK